MQDLQWELWQHLGLETHRVAHPGTEYLIVKDAPLRGQVAPKVTCARARRRFGLLGITDQSLLIPLLSLRNSWAYSKNCWHSSSLDFAW
jgi:hypothetical protein